MARRRKGARPSGTPRVSPFSSCGLLVFLLVACSMPLAASAQESGRHDVQPLPADGVGEAQPNGGLRGEAGADDSDRLADDEERGEAVDEEICPGTGDDATYIVEAVEIRGNRRTLDRVILREVAFHPGEVLDLDDPKIELSRYRLLATGLFSEVSLSLRRGSRRGAVVLVVEVRERWTFILREVFFGVSEITPYGGFELEELNLLGRNTSLAFAFVVSDEQQGYRAHLEIPRFLDRPVSLGFGVIVNNARDFLGRYPVLVTGSPDAVPYAEVAYRRVGGTLGVGVRLARSTYLRLDYRLELVRADLPAAAAQLGSPLGPGIGEPIDFHLEAGRSILSAFVISVDRDTRDHPFLPSQGHRVSLATVVASDVIGSSYHFVKLTLVADLYLRFRWRHSLHLGLLIGSIFGTAPLYERYFIGDLSDQMHTRVLDLNFSHAPPPNVFRNATEEMQYESLAGRLDLEYIVPLYRGRSVVYGLDFFVLVGLYSLGSIEDFRSPPAGYVGGAFPFDFTVDLGFRLDTTAGIFGFSFSNLLGLIPFSEG